MGKKVRSAKGEIVDFDYLKIKEQLAAAPTPMEVKNRQNFIENRLKRRIKKKLPIVEKAAVEVIPKLPEPEGRDITAEMEQPLIVDPAIDEKAKPATKQKARKKQKVHD